MALPPSLHSSQCVRPDFAFFGQKDGPTIIIRRLVRDLAFDRNHRIPTVRGDQVGHVFSQSVPKPEEQQAAAVIIVLGKGEGELQSGRTKWRKLTEL